MPIRKIPLVKDQIYHVYNRSIALQPIFRDKREFNIYINLIEYYKFSNPPMRFSYFSRLKKEEKVIVLENLYKSDKRLVDIYAFSLMPNHYHILLKQKEEKGITNFIRLIQNSYAHYLNIKTKRFGSLFQSPFKAVRIENDQQFIHVARYIHLNPITSYLIANPNHLDSYEWCSYKDYLGINPRKFVDTSFLFSFFKDKEKFKKFTLDQVDYQRHLERIKHLTIN